VQPTSQAISKQGFNSCSGPAICIALTTTDGHRHQSRLQQREVRQVLAPLFQPTIVARLIFGTDETVGPAAMSIRDPMVSLSFCTYGAKLISSSPSGAG
jgi:hypothetical protein